MSSQSNRLTTFPHSSHYHERSLPRKRRSSANGEAEKRRYVRDRHTPPPPLPPPPPVHPPHPQQNHILPSTTSLNANTNANDFRRIIAEYQAGEGIVAHRDDSSFPLVLLKKRAKAQSDTECLLTSTHHPNLVNLLAFFEHDGAINLVYECMQVSLLQLQPSPYNAFVEYELAAICKEVLPDMVIASASAELKPGLTGVGVYP